MISNRQQLTAGTIIGGRYSIVKPIGQGGMAYVYLATDQQTGGSVAVKVMKSDLIHDQEFIKRFDTEAKAASSLDHPNIVKVLGFGQDGDLRYIVQEFVEGATLKDLIQQRGALDWTQAVPLAIQIGLALEHAHKRGVVHRDIKPHNILITKDLVAKVTDFGIARAVNANTITLTSGMTFGSVHYFSPEQARGSIVSEKSDLYSLGILIFEMVTGEVPFDGETSVAIAIKHLQEAPPMPSSINRSIPHGLDSIILKCIQKSPDSRYKDVRELVDELDAFMVDPAGVYGVVTNVSDRDANTSALGLKRPEPNYGKLREIEKTINDRRRSRQRDVGIVIGIILLAVIFLTSIGVWVWGEIQSSLPKSSNDMITLENYIGENIEEVTPKLDELKIDYRIVEEPNTAARGQIIGQTPGQGIDISPDGTTVLVLTVSKGMETLSLADYAGNKESAAKLKLEQLGFKVELSYEPSDTIEKGAVIKSNPPSGTLVYVGDTINLVICSGKQTFLMPNLVGMSVQAVRDLQTNGLNLVIFSPLTNIHVDPVTGLPAEVVGENLQIIIKQFPEPDTEINFGQVITLTYGDMQDYLNFLNPTPTPEPTPLPTETTVPPTPTPPETTAPTTTATPTTTDTTPATSDTKPGNTKP